VSRIWSSWLEILGREETGESLALWRISMGLVLIFSLLQPLVAGAVPVIWLPIEHGGYLLFKHSSWMMELLGGPTPARVYGALGLGLAAGCCLVLGIGSRIAAFIGLQCFMALAWINPHTGGSYDVLITNGLWLLVLAQSDATWSVQARLREGSWSSALKIAAWPRYLVILQLVIMYASSGWHKLSVYWVPGGDFSALYYIMQQPSWQRVDMSWLAHIYPLTQASTALSWFFETLGAPLLLVALWARNRGEKAGRIGRLLLRTRYREVFMVVGLGMHLVIALAMEVGPFSWASMAYYAALLRPDEIAGLGSRIRSLKDSRSRARLESP
jgi:hypothetical protein